MQEIMKEKTVRQFILLSSMFTMSHMVTAGIYVTFLQSHGMSLLQVNLINTIYFVTIFICEIPTGAYADIFGRKQSFVMACVLRGMAEWVYGMSSTLWGFVTAEILAAIGMTFMTGAFKSWLVDSLLHRGYSEVGVRVFGRAKYYSQAWGVMACIIGSYLGSISLAIPWFVGSGIVLSTAITAHFIMKEEYFVHRVSSLKEKYFKLKHTIVSGIRYGMTDKAVRFILIVSFVQILSVQPFNMYWQPFFGSHGVATVHFGYIYTGMMATLAIGAWIASRVHADGKERVIIIRSQITVGSIMMLTAVLSGLPIILAFFLLHEVGRGFWEPMRDAYLHKRIPSHERATIDSFCSISPHVGGALGLASSGAIAQYGGIPMSWIVGGLVLIMGALLVARNGKAKNI